MGALVVSIGIVHGVSALPSIRVAVAGLATWIGAVFVAAGIRAYFAFFMWCSLAAVLILAGVSRQWKTSLRRLAITTIVLALTGSAYLAGAGRDDRYWREATRMLVWSESAPTVQTVAAAIMTRIDQARLRFQRSRGGTNVAPLTPAEARANRGNALSAAGDAADSIQWFDASRRLARRLGVGLATLVVPISALQAMSVTDFRGGRGLLVVTDIDTMFIDATLLAGAVLLYMRRGVVRRQLPYVRYLLFLGGGTALLLAYVVTNFGTQFRLRLLAVVPLWMLLLASIDGRLSRRDLRPLEFDGRAGVG
jgi:hypothetical protein